MITITSRMSIGLIATLKLHPSDDTDSNKHLCHLCNLWIVCENLWPMLQFLNISNIALIDDMQVEFESGLNLLTGETGSGKSIIVDALGVLIGGRFTSELLKSGAERGSIEGLFSVTPNPELELLLENAGLEQTSELIIRR